MYLPWKKILFIWMNCAHQLNFINMMNNSLDDFIANFRVLKKLIRGRLSRSRVILTFLTPLPYPIVTFRQKSVYPLSQILNPPPPPSLFKFDTPLPLPLRLWRHIWTPHQYQYVSNSSDGVYRRVQRSQDKSFGIDKIKRI